MKKKFNFKKAAYIVGAFLLIAYMGYNGYLKMTSIINTEYAVLTTSDKIVEADCFVIRDEVVGDAENNRALIKSSDSGVYVPYVDDGSRVGSEETIALFFASQSDAKNYLEKQDLMKDLEYYQSLQNQSLLSFLDVDTLDMTINSDILSLLKATESGDYSTTDKIVSSLRHNISSRQIATGQSVDFSGQINELKKSISELSGAGANYKTITAKTAGYFVSTVDGYEAVAKYSDVKNLGVSDVEKLIDSNPSKVSDNVIGKIVDGFNWYAVCTVPHNSLGKLKIGSDVSVNFVNTSVKNIKMKVYNISESVNNTVAIVLSGNLMDSDIAKLRKEKIQIIVEKYEGLKIPNEALRTRNMTVTDEDGNEKQEDVLGVYVLCGQIVKFKAVDILYYDNNYVIGRNGDSTENELALNDMIITKGRNVYDGKVVY